MQRPEKDMSFEGDLREADVMWCSTAHSGTNCSAIRGENGACVFHERMKVCIPERVHNDLPSLWKMFVPFSMSSKEKDAVAIVQSTRQAAANDYVVHNTFLQDLVPSMIDVFISRLPTLSDTIPQRVFPRSTERGSKFVRAVLSHNAQEEGGIMETPRKGFSHMGKAESKEMRGARGMLGLLAQWTFASAPFRFMEDPSVKDVIKVVNHGMSSMVASAVKILTKSLKIGSEVVQRIVNTLIQAATRAWAWVSKFVSMTGEFIIKILRFMREKTMALICSISKCSLAHRGDVASAIEKELDEQKVDAKHDPGSE